MKDSLLLRMRQTGWFDVWLFALAAAIVMLAIGTAGVIQYNVQMDKMPAHFNEYQVNEALGSLAHARGSFLRIGKLALLISIIGFTLLAISVTLSPKLSRKTKDRLGYLLIGLQYLTALAVTLVMLFPIYWMVISSLKTSHELLLPVPTL